MVKSLMYCSEQIHIPVSFPDILKTYAKAAIRTQPKDLLKWSAAYFRCLSLSLYPPSKEQIERDILSGKLSKGYLKVLIHQVGKGFFLSRKMLQIKWQDLCLPEDDLLTYLSLSRMLNWPQVHWLKLFTVMVGTLNETPMETLKMLCELLTNDLEGGPCRIPLWMFKICYVFLSELDCSEEQSFINGRKLLDCERLEDEVPMTYLPKVFPAVYGEHATLEEGLKQYSRECLNDIEPESSPKRSESSVSCRPSTPGSSIVFYNEGCVDEKFINEIGDFDSLIIFMQQGSKDSKMHDFELPRTISQKHLNSVKKREETFQILREKHTEMVEENALSQLYQDQLKMLTEIGPPWSWLQQFASENCMEKSHNYIDESSIISDKTPDQSSDEENISPQVVAISPCTSVSTLSVGSLLKSVSSSKSQQFTEFDAALEDFRNSISEASSAGKVVVSVPSSILSYLEKEEYNVIERAGEKIQNNFLIDSIRQFLFDAERQAKNFDNIDEVIEYIRDKCDVLVKSKKIVVEKIEVDNTSMPECKLKEDVKLDLVDDLKTSNRISDNNSKTTKKDFQEKNNEDFERPPKEKNTMDDFKNEDLTKGTIENKTTIPQVITLNVIKKGRQTSDDESSNITITDNDGQSFDGNYSDISSKLHSPTSESLCNVISEKNVGLLCEDSAVDNLPPNYTCTVGPYPGIGPIVKPKTIEAVLAYLSCRARIQQGMIMPKNLIEENCPKIVD